MRLAVVAILALVACGSTAKVILTSCARMDVPILSKVAQAACISSCKFQNCGTGSCKKRSGRPVCVCSRCDKGGGSWPSIPSRRRSERGAVEEAPPVAIETDWTKMFARTQ